ATRKTLRRGRVLVDDGGVHSRGIHRSDARIYAEVVQVDLTVDDLHLLREPLSVRMFDTRLDLSNSSLPPTAAMAEPCSCGRAKRLRREASGITSKPAGHRKPEWRSLHCSRLGGYKGTVLANRIRWKPGSRAAPRPGTSASTRRKTSLKTF